MRTRLLLVLPAAAIGACVPYPDAPVEDGGAAALPPGGYAELAQGASAVTSAHFKLSAYGADAAKSLSEQAEQSFTRLTNDSGLATFSPTQPYKILVYGSQEEYRKKTGQADWSMGVVADGAIYTYSSERMPARLTHLIAHAVWRDFMGGRSTDQQRWVDEGLAVYEESKAEERRMFDTFRPMLASTPIPVDQLQNMAPADERSYDATLWYAEAWGLVRFMIERGGRINFANFLNGLQRGQTFDQAVAAGFPGQWQTLAALSADWQRSLQ